LGIDVAVRKSYLCIAQSKIVVHEICGVAAFQEGLAMPELSREDAERQIRQLQARMARQQVLAAELTRHGFKGAAAEAMVLAATLQNRLNRTAAFLNAAT
jgi:hypothetical protein